MSFGQFDINTGSESTFSKQKKFQWYWAPIFCTVWFLLFYVTAIPSFYSYPEMLLMRDEHKHPDEFIGERAQIQLLGLTNIGIKLTGSVENEVYALNYLLQEIDKIKAAARLDLYDIDVQLQYASGQFMLWHMATSYRNMSNIIVRIVPKRAPVSESYLLLNSHFDSEVGSPAAADAGVMIVTMLETLRVISRSEQELKNPIVFLLNGAEESNLLASHGFITQHEWAPYCKALINLDSAGSGGREILFQTGPDHPWLMKYYKQSVPHPYATTIAEEMFQNNFIPSDTDFRIFRDYRGVPGLDMAHSLNGYVYHTKYDTFSNLERGTYQTTGDNVLALTRALANAEELRNPAAHAEGHTVFYDYLGWFVISYSETTGIVINVVTSICALLIIGFSIYRMNQQQAKTKATEHGVYRRFVIILLVQILTVLAAIGLTILIGVIVNAMGLSLSWYSAEWIIFGLYYCPMFFVMGMIPALFIHWTKKNPMIINHTLSCFMHAHCILLVFICLLLTGLSIRSAFFGMIAIFFYAVSVVLNILGDFFFKKSYFLPIHLLCQLLPYWFYTYLAFGFLKTFVPMQGRDGPDNKPELFVSTFSAIMSLHFSGFIIPVIHKFRKSKTFFSMFGLLTVVFVIIAATPAGFPFKAEVAPQRYYVLHTNRIIHDQFGYVSKNDSGFYIQPVDTRPKTLDDTTFSNAYPQSWIDKQCAEEVFCGLPLYNTRWMDWKNSSRWIPANPPNLQVSTQLTLKSKQYVSERKVRFSFSLYAADRLVIYVDPLPGIKVTDWSFDRTPIKDNYATPYFIYHVYSMVEEPLEFWLEIERESSVIEGHSLRLGVGAHLQYHTHTYTQEFKDFLKSFPEWAYPTNWVAAFESWYF